MTLLHFFVCFSRIFSLLAFSLLIVEIENPKAGPLGSGKSGKFGPVLVGNLQDDIKMDKNFGAVFRAKVHETKIK